MVEFHPQSDGLKPTDLDPGIRPAVEALRAAGLSEKVEALLLGDFPFENRSHVHASALRRVADGSGFSVLAECALVKTTAPAITS